MRRTVLECCQRLHISDVKEAIPKGSTAVELAVGEGTLHLIGKLTNLGNGYRYFFLCPLCERPFESLYRKDFGGYACRECLNLIYRSSRTRRRPSAKFSGIAGS